MPSQLNLNGVIFNFKNIIYPVNKMTKCDQEKLLAKCEEDEKQMEMYSSPFFIFMYIVAAVGFLILGLYAYAATRPPEAPTPYPTMSNNPNPYQFNYQQCQSCRARL
jgi:hypothetical protein